jgi:hypothetical protein
MCPTLLGCRYQICQAVAEVIQGHQENVLAAGAGAAAAAGADHGPAEEGCGEARRRVSTDGLAPHSKRPCLGAEHQQQQQTVVARGMDEQQPNAAVAAAAGHGVRGKEVDVINLVVRPCHRGAELAFKVRPTTRMGKIFKAYCLARHIKEESVIFVYEGIRILEEYNCIDLELKDGDTLDVIPRQHGD